MERGQKRRKGAHSCLEGAERRPPGCLRSSQVGVRQGQGCGLSASQGTSEGQRKEKNPGPRELGEEGGGQAGGGDAVCPALGDTRHGSEARALAATTLRPGLSPELLGKGPPCSAGAAKLVGEDPRAASGWMSPQGELEPSQCSWEQSWGWRRKRSPGGWAGGPSQQAQS